MNNKISSTEINILSTYLLKSCIMINGINFLLNITKNNSIISTTLGFLIGFLFILIYNKLKSKTIIDILDEFLKFISVILKTLLILIIFIFSSYLLYTISLFINKCFLINMDILPISTLFILCSTYLFSKGIKTICKSSLICFFILILLETISILFLIPNINSEKILPILNSSLLDITKSSIIYTILSVSPIFLLLIIPQKDKDTNNKNNIKLYYIITNLYIIFNFILLLCIIDYRFALIINYPELFILSKRSVLNFFDRMEGILSFKLIFDTSDMDILLNVNLSYTSSNGSFFSSSKVIG